MSFVNEYILEEDIKKYGIESLNKKLYIANYKSTWTVDHERDIYLRRIKNRREERCNEVEYCFYWQGHLMKVVLKQEGGGEHQGPQWRHYEMLDINIPEEIKQNESQVITDLKEALVAYKTLGVFSNCTSHKATFGF